MKRSSGISRRASIALNRLRTEVSPIAVDLRGAVPSFSFSSLRPAEDVGRLVDPALLVEEARAAFRPSPRCRRRGASTKWFRCSSAGTDRRTRRCSGARAPSSPPAMTSRARRCAADTGNGSGSRRARRRAGAPPSTTPTICGITSPARWMITVSPTRMSLRAISSALCKVAFSTTTPPTVTGSSGDRRHRAGAADLDVDGLEDRAAPARRGTCARSPSAASGRRSPGAPASRAGRPCRRRRRCRSRDAARWRSISRWTSSKALDRAAHLWPAAWS